MLLRMERSCSTNQNCLSVWVQKEGPLLVSPEHEVLANGRDWAQLVSRDPHDHIGTWAKLVTLGFF